MIFADDFVYYHYEVEPPVGEVFRYYFFAPESLFKFKKDIKIVASLYCNIREGSSPLVYKLNILGIGAEKPNASFAALNISYIFGSINKFSNKFLKTLKNELIKNRSFACNCIECVKCIAEIIENDIDIIINNSTIRNIIE